MTAVFQSNQNDRVTLERHREDIFLASRSHRDALFFFSPVFVLFIFISFFCSDAGRMTAWHLSGCLFTEQELMRQSGLSAEGVEREREREGLTASHHLLF